LYGGRLGTIEYRAPWIAFDAEPDTILAYAKRDFLPPAGKGSIVMRLDGTVEWLPESEFDKQLKKQQSDAEIRLFQKSGKF